MGAALASLFAFELACHENTKSVVTCIGIASPRFSDRLFRSAFNYLERQGKLRCLNVSNQFDPSPLMPNSWLVCLCTGFKMYGTLVYNWYWRRGRLASLLDTGKIVSNMLIELCPSSRASIDSLVSYFWWTFCVMLEGIITITANTTIDSQITERSWAQSLWLGYTNRSRKETMTRKTTNNL